MCSIHVCVCDTEGVALCVLHVGLCAVLMEEWPRLYIHACVTLTEAMVVYVQCGWPCACATRARACV